MRWNFEPGHTGVEFAVRHMMITIVRGYYKNISGVLEFDPADPQSSSVNVTIEASNCETKEPERDAHLRGPDFLDCANYPKIFFQSTNVEPVACNRYKLAGDLTIRGITRTVILDVEYCGRAKTPFNDTRIGFLATTKIDRYDFGVSWNNPMPEGGVVVARDVEITIDVEAIRSTNEP